MAPCSVDTLWYRKGEEAERTETGEYIIVIFALVINYPMHSLKSVLQVCQPSRTDTLSIQNGETSGQVPLVPGTGILH